LSETECCAAATPEPLSATLAGEFAALLAMVMAPVALPAATGANCAVRVTDWPGVSVTDAGDDVTLNPVPVAVTEEMVTFEVPVFVSVSLNWLVLPSVTLPKDKLDELSESNCVAAAPVPESARLSGESAALLTRVTEPATAPDAVGSKTTLNEAVFPAAIVSGVDIPAVVMPEPLTSTWLIVMVATPALLKVIVWEFEVPVATLPKLTDDGVAFRTRLTPVPESAMLDAEPVELLETEIKPLALPATVGSKLTVRVALWPTLRVSGRERAEML